MKHLKQHLLTVLFIAASLTAFTQVGIGTTTPDASSVLDLESTTLGFLPPRMDTTQRNAIPNPTAGLTIFNTTAKCLQWFDGGFWIDGCGATPEAIPNANLTAANVTYQGTSVIDATGIGYNGEAVPAASTITVELSNTSPDAQSYGLIATDSTTGLSYSATGTIAGSANGVSVVLSPNDVVMPEFTSGVITMALTGTSSTLNLVPRIDVKSIPTSSTTVKDVSYGSQIWMDRNLGARREATALDDVFSYGSYYQWGRPADGHEISVWNGTTKTSGRGLADATALNALATTDAPGHPNFIVTNASPYDWRSGNNDNRWVTANQGPCPAGYHVPTNAEWDVAITYNGGPATSGGATAGWDNNVEIFASNLKIPSVGERMANDGLLYAGNYARYWSSTVSNTNARYLNTHGSIVSTHNETRGNGFSVRCLKN